MGALLERAARSPRSIDALLACLVLIWGTNFSLLKVAFREMPPLPFNALRLVLSVSVFLGAIAATRRITAADRGGLASVFATSTPVTTRDWLELVALGIIGHFFYQIGFVGGVAATSVANAALIIGSTPVVIAILSAVIRGERLGFLHWLGAAISLVGIYFVVGVGSSFSGASWRGDVLVMFSVLCWATYTIGGGRLISRHSPLFVTGVTMAFGAVPYVIWAWPEMRAMDWGRVSAWTWGALVFSGVLALNVSYLIWYVAVRQIGPSRTAIVSNLVPLVAMVVAALWLGEPITAAKTAGAAAVLGGVVLTRLGAHR